MDTPQRDGRRRNAAASREALLAAAAELFAERGYDRTTVRDVSAAAGVNQALLFRYFGSKQDLFAEVLEQRGNALLDQGDPATLPRRALASMLANLGEPESDWGHLLSVVLRSCGDERAARLLRDELGQRYATELSELTAAPDAELRSELVLGWFLGIGMMRSVLGVRSIVEADPETVCDHVMRGVATLLERTDQEAEPTASPDRVRSDDT